MVLVFIAGMLIVVGLVLAIYGFASEPDPEPIDGYGAEEEPSLLATLLAMMKTLFRTMFAAATPKWKRFASFGVFLVLLGVAFLLSAGITVLVGSVSDDAVSDTPEAPATSISPTASPT